MAGRHSAVLTSSVKTPSHFASATQPSPAGGCPSVGSIGPAGSGGAASPAVFTSQVCSTAGCSAAAVSRSASLPKPALWWHVELPRVFVVTGSMSPRAVGDLCQSEFPEPMCARSVLRVQPTGTVHSAGASRGTAWTIKNWTARFARSGTVSSPEALVVSSPERVRRADRFLLMAASKTVDRAGSRDQAMRI